MFLTVLMTIGIELMFKEPYNYAEDHSYELVIQNPHGDVEAQIKRVKYMIAKGIDALIISPTDPKALTEITDWCVEEKGIPVICTNTTAVTDFIAITVMSGIDKVGEMTAEAMIEAVKRKVLKKGLLSSI